MVECAPKQFFTVFSKNWVFQGFRKFSTFSTFHDISRQSRHIDNNSTRRELLNTSSASPGWECQVVDVSRMSRISKKPWKTRKVKKKLHVTILKMDSLHSLHLMCRVMNSRHINSTCKLYTLTSIYNRRWHQFTTDIANPSMEWHWYTATSWWPGCEEGSTLILSVLNRRCALFVKIWH